MHRYNWLIGVAKGVLAVWLCSVMVIEGLVLEAASLEESYPVEYVIVLGAGLQGDQISPTLRYRLDKCLAYLKTYPLAKVVVSGGQGLDEYISEAEAMKRYLVARDIDEDRVLVEDKSTSTYENMLFSKRILNQEQWGEESKVIVVTSEFHMFRAKLLAARVGFNAYGLCAESVNYLKPYYYFREYFVVIKTLIIDR